MNFIMIAIDGIQFSYKFHDKFVQRMLILASQDWKKEMELAAQVGLHAFRNPTFHG
jgi:hypothetical protein